jgi:L-2-hydroxyglutarate oxidase
MLYDYAIVGGGIVGLATALAILDSSKGASVLLVEKEEDFAQHQTGHNSGVIHAGIYYTPGSLKAELCRAGLAATISFCGEHGIPYDQCGKLIVATNPLEVERVDALYERATANGLNLRRLSEGALRELEPNIRGTAALLSPETAIVDYSTVARTMADLLRARGVDFFMGHTIDRIAEGAGHVELGAASSSWLARKVVVCGGLQADRLAKLAGLETNFRIVPFRGEYFRLPDSKSDIAKHLIYPAPNPKLPFLGIHLTRVIDGSMIVGPNAILGLAREGYEKHSVNFSDVASFLTFAGFWRLIWANKRHAVHELKGSLCRAAYLADCQKYCPALEIGDLLPYRAGIRAQVVMRDGTAVHDFLFLQSARTLHVCNAPSPAATSAIPIGRMIAKRLSHGKM